MQHHRPTYNPSTPSRAQRLGEPWIDQRTSNNIRFTFSGKERDEETGYNYFGARYYNSDISIWLSVDPLSDKYPSLSPYVYCANNPLIIVDPDGREIWIIGEDGTRTRYIPGMSYEGDEFTYKTVLALNYLHSTDTYKAIVESFSSDTYHHIELIKNFETHLHSGVQESDNGEGILQKDVYISFNPRLGLVGREGTDQEGNLLYPAEGLGHELGHRKNQIDSPKLFLERRANRYDNGHENSIWRNEEEYYNINKYEIPSVRERVNGLIRNGHNPDHPNSNFKEKRNFETPIP